jgi:hypothetical protein
LSLTQKNALLVLNHRIFSEMASLTIEQCLQHAQKLRAAVATNLLQVNKCICRQVALRHHAATSMTILQAESSNSKLLELVCRLCALCSLLHKQVVERCIASLDVLSVLWSA